MGSKVWQATVKQALRFSGVGLHSGRPCSIELLPSPAGTGIYFGSSQKNERNAGVMADYRLVEHGSPLCTELRDPGKQSESGVGIIRTVEHLMAALWASGVSNCQVVVQNDEDTPTSSASLESCELPVLDGSSIIFSDALAEQVLPQLDGHLPVVRVLRRVAVHDKEKESSAELSPFEGPAVSAPMLDLTVYVDSFSGRLPMTAKSKVQYGHTFGDMSCAQEFRAEFAAARTFAFEKEVEWLQGNGLALGGSLENAVVFKGDGSSSTLNEGGAPLRQ